MFMSVTGTLYNMQTEVFSIYCTSMRNKEYLLPLTGIYACIKIDSICPESFWTVAAVSKILLLLSRPYLWGSAATQHYQQKQEAGWLLWKQPRMLEVLELLDRKRLFQSTANFPISVSLEVIHP
jgi:hypothetical protein